MTPIFFLERFQRIFGVDQELTDSDDTRVGNLARKMLRCMLLSSTYLRFKPSQVAAAALLLSININSSVCAQLMGAPSVLDSNILQAKAFYKKTKTIDQADNGLILSAQSNSTLASSVASIEERKE